MYVLLYLLKALRHMAALLVNGSASQLTTLMRAPPTPTHRQVLYCVEILCLHFVQVPYETVFVM